MNKFKDNNSLFRNYTLSIFVFIGVLFSSYQTADATACNSNTWASLKAANPWGVPGGNTFTHGGYNWRVCFHFTFGSSPYNHTWKTSACGGTAHYLSRYETCSDASAPSVSTSTSQSKTSTSGYFNGNVTNNNGATVTSRGFKWGTTSNPTTSVTVGSGNGTYNYNKTGLNPGTTYHYRAWATNSEGTTQGSVLNFTTSVLAPTVTTTDAASILSSSATLGGNVTNANGATVTSRGIKWGTTSNPTTSITIGSGTGAFTTSLGSLSPGTEYYYRSWATNSAGTTDGTVKSFTTSALAPTVTTTDAASILSSSATLGGNVTNANGATVTSRGIKWGTTSNPTTSITIGSGTGVFTTSLGSLSPGTEYYYRSWATNSAGTTNGTVKSFTTSALAPTVTTTDAASIRIFIGNSWG